ncbi:FAD-dependent oxidoreductase [Oceanimonas sp. NS1]|nr:FAD-dependent oxidoreductase [Oceanimonas sp. NS1]
MVIIGSGFTGLSAALHLARDHGIKATILEANQVSWAAPAATAARPRMLGPLDPLPVGQALGAEHRA